MRGIRTFWQFIHKVSNNSQYAAYAGDGILGQLGMKLADHQIDPRKAKITLGLEE
jgi:hypothetical protein